MRKQVDTVLHTDKILDTATNTLTWQPDYSVLGHWDPGNPKSLIMVYQPMIAYRSYGVGPDVDVSYANARTVRNIKVVPLSVSLNVDLDSAEVALDKNGRL